MRVLGWLLLVPGVGYLALQVAIFLDWLVIRDFAMSWNIPLLAIALTVIVVGEGLRLYGKYSRTEVNNAEK